MGKRSKIMEMTRARLIESAKRRTPEERLLACINLSVTVSALREAGEAYRAGVKNFSKPNES